MTSFDSFDNRSKILKDNLVAKIKAGDKMAVAAAYFSIFGFQELKTQLEGLEEMRFLYTAPTFLKEKTDYKAREFYIPRLGREHGVAGTKLEIRLRNELNQRAIARECADWIRKKASFRSFITQENVPSFLEVETVDDSYVYQNIEGITATGIGATPGSSPFTCITRQGSETAKQYLALFNQAWSSDAVTEDVTEQIIESITTMYKENAPELIYYSVLFDIFSEFLNNVDEDDLPKEAAGFKDSLIWNALYDFQKDAALAIINKLETYNGCILADSVGLGKTYTALAVIKYYEARNRNVLGDFVRVHFKAEWTKIYLLQTFLYHTQGCHLLSNKQHTLALKQGIGYKVRNGLRLTRSRRAVKDIRVSLSGLHYSGHLRRVYRNRQCQIRWFYFFILAFQVRHHLGWSKRKFLFHKTTHHIVIQQFLSVVMNVVPHEELTEREYAQNTFFFYVPTLFVFQHLTYDGEDFFHIHTMIILWQRIKSRNSNVEVLP